MTAYVSIAYWLRSRPGRVVQLEPNALLFCCLDFQGSINSTWQMVRTPFCFAIVVTNTNTIIALHPRHVQLTQTAQSGAHISIELLLQHTYSASRGTDSISATATYHRVDSGISGIQHPYSEYRNFELPSL